MLRHFDLEGKKFGLLTVIECDKSKSFKGKGTYWKCKCSCGNLKIVSTGQLRSGKGKSCGCLQRTRPTIRVDMKRVKTIIKSQDRTLLDHKYENGRLKLKIRCNESSHEVWQSWQAAKKWKCKRCVRLSKNFLENALGKSSHTLLSDYSEYKNNRSKLRILCPTGQVIFTSFSNFDCFHLICDSSKFIGEEVVRACFEYYFDGHKFPKTRIKDMLSPKGRPMEFDGFNDELRLGFEVQGVQHREISYFSENKRKLHNTMNRDKLKAQYEKENHLLILRIDIDNHPQYENFPQIIATMLSERGRPVTKRIPLLDELKPFGTTRLQEMQKIAKSRGGKLLSTLYLGNEHALHFMCQEGHRFEMKPVVVKKGCWCQTCAWNRAASEKRHTITYVKKFIVDLGGTPHFDTYKNAQVPLLISCPHGVVYNRSFGNIQQRGILIQRKCSKCRSCLKNIEGRD